MKRKWITKGAMLSLGFSLGLLTAGCSDNGAQDQWAFEEVGEGQFEETYDALDNNNDGLLGWIVGRFEQERQALQAEDQTFTSDVPMEILMGDAASGGGDLMQRAGNLANVAESLGLTDGRIPTSEEISVLRDAAQRYGVSEERLDQYRQQILDGPGGQ